MRNTDRSCLLIREGEWDWAILLQDKKVIDLLVSHSKPSEILTPKTGAVYRARITQIFPESQSAFIDIGNKTKGFLSKIGAAKTGDILLVQCQRPAEQDKYARFSTQIKYIGHSVIYNPMSSDIAYSKTLKKLGLSQDFKDQIESLSIDGLIIREAAIDVPIETVVNEINFFHDQHQHYFNNSTTIGLIRPAPSLFESAMGEWRCKAITANQNAVDALEKVAQFWPIRIDNTDLLNHYDIIPFVQLRCKKTLPLGTSGEIHFERTSACLCIDIDASQSQAKSQLSINLQAAKILASEISIRGFGGQIIIDFAGNKTTNLKKQLAPILKESFSHANLAEWGPLGLFEIIVPKTRKPLCDIIKYHEDFIS